MKRYNLVCVAVAALILTLVTGPVFSQEDQQPISETVETSSAKESMSQAEEISIYGEVKSVNPASNAIALQYYDYDTDEEKTAEIILNKDTKIENITNLSDLKQDDWVDVIYSISDAKNVAKSIKVEKEEEVSPEEKSENALVESMSKD